MNQDNLLEKIREIKAAPFGSISAQTQFLGRSLQIKLLAAECAADRDMMALLGRWRKENEMWYLSQFEVSVERTTKWFQNNLIATPDRILFVVTSDGALIGHVGLFRFDFTRETCEIDNILRGEAICPGAMGCAITLMMGWGGDVLGLKGYSLRVLSDNLKAIRLYERLGYVETQRTPLIQVMGRDGMEWTEAPIGYVDQVSRYYVTMVFKADR